ncbi:MAG: transporter substrate-binding domain-containing protein [Desulfobacter sp.]|nr:MAG: transporter substrate-binding domain-containing protein [Desulfobacter sp.]
MKYLNQIILIAFIVCCTGTHPIYAESITIAAEDDWIPYARQDGTGLANEIIRAAYESIGIRVKYDVIPYARVLLYLEIGRYIGGFNVPLDKTSVSRYILGKKPLFNAVSAYYENINNPLIARNRDQLTHGEKIGVVRGYGYGNHYLDSVGEGLIIEEVSNSEISNLKKLALGRIDGTIIYSKTADILIKQLALDTKIRFAFINESTPIYLAFSRAHPKGQYFADKFDEGMIKIQTNGVYQKIMNSY